MESGYDLRVMMPYLSRQLRHASVDETFYYYHQVIDAHRIIRQKDNLSSLVLPEVRVK
jgi:integrase